MDMVGLILQLLAAVVGLGVILLYGPGQRTTRYSDPGPRLERWIQAVGPRVDGHPWFHLVMALVSLAAAAGTFILPILFLMRALTIEAGVILALGWVGLVAVELLSIPSDAPWAAPPRSSLAQVLSLCLLTAVGLSILGVLPPLRLWQAAIFVVAIQGGMTLGELRQPGGLRLGGAARYDFMRALPYLQWIGTHLREVLITAGATLTLGIGFQLIAAIGG